MAVTGKVPTLIDLRRSSGRSDPFVGRVEELSALRCSWPPVTIVFGEPGGGKSRLLLEAARRGRASSTMVSCHPSAQTIPLEPLLAVANDLRSGNTRPREWERPSEGGRLVVIRDQLEREAATGALLIQIDDAHWADDQTLDGVAYLADRLRNAPIRWHVAARIGDDRCERLAVRLAQMLIGEVLRLREFGIAEFRSFVAKAVDQQLDEAAIGELYALSGGNPLYTEQLVVAAAAGETTQPAGLNALLAERIQSLSDGQIRVARAMAVIGEATQVPTLSQLSGLPESIDSLVAELEARFIAKISPMGVQFRHDLLRRACYSWTPSEERIRLHRAMADLCTDTWHRIFHLDGAGLRNEAAEALLQHGLSMIDRADCVEARAALEGAVTRAGDKSDVSAQANAGLAAIVALSGETELAREMMGRVEALSDKLTPALRAEMRGRFAEAVFEGSDDTVVPLEFLKFAIDDARVAAPQALPRLYRVAGAVADRSGESRAAEELLSMGVSALRPSTPSRDRVQLKSWMGVVRARRGDPDRGMVEVAEAAETAFAHGLTSEFAQACLKCCYVSDLRSDREAYESWCRRGLEVDGTKLPRVAAHLRLNLATALKDRGALEEALLAGEVAYIDAHNGGKTLRVQAGCSLALTYAMLGKFADAFRIVGEIQRYDVSDRWRRAIEYVAGRVFEMSDDLDSALGCYAGVALAWVDRFEPEGTDVRAKAGEARVLYQLGRLTELSSVWESAKKGFERGWPLGASLRAEIEGYALIADGRVDEGAASLLDAARTSKERFRAAYLKATAGLAKADRDLINAAICELDEMGAQIACESIRRKARGIGLRPRHRPRSKLAVTGSDVRIASLIRAGKTNAEIGAQLGLSTKTVEHYVSNMLSKLGLRSRAQLAATIGSDPE